MHFNNGIDSKGRAGTPAGVAMKDSQDMILEILEGVMFSYVEA